MEQSCTAPNQVAPSEMRHQPVQPSPLVTPVMRESSQPYADAQETTSHWRNSDRTQNGVRETEGTEKLSRAVQRSESKTPTGGSSTSSIEEISSRVISKTLETSHGDVPKVEYRMPTPFPQNGPLSTGVNKISAQLMTNSENASKTVNEWRQLQDQPSDSDQVIAKMDPELLLKEGYGLKTKPYTERQEAFSQSKASKATETGDKEIVSQEKMNDAVQHSVSQTPDTTVSRTVAGKFSQSSVHENEISKQQSLQAAVSTPSAPVSSSIGQNGKTSDTKDESSAKTFLQSISNYLFSWNDTPPTGLSSPAQRCSEASSRQSECAANVPSPTKASCTNTDRSSNMQTQCNQSSESTEESHSASGLKDKIVPNDSQIVPKFKMTDDAVKQGLSQATTEVMQALNTHPGQAPLRTAFSVEENAKSNALMREESQPSHNKEAVPLAPTRLSEVGSSQSSVDFKTGLSFFKSDMSENRSPTPTPIQAETPRSTENPMTGTQNERFEKIKINVQEPQASDQPAIKINAPACFAPKSWAPVKPPVPVVKTSVPPLRQTCPVSASEAEGQRVTSSSAVGSTQSSTAGFSLPLNSNLTSSAESRKSSTFTTRMSQINADATDLKQTQTNTGSAVGSPLGHDPVSAAPFPGLKPELKLGSMQRTNSLPFQKARCHTSSGVKQAGIEEVQTSTDQVQPSNLDSSKSESTEQKQNQTLSESNKTLGRPMQLEGPPPSLDSISSKTAKSLSIQKNVSAIPYVDRQETINKSKVCEKTEACCRESETEETRKQSVQQSSSQTPTMSSFTTIEEDSTHTVSQSNEVVYGSTLQGQCSSQGPKSSVSEMPHQTEFTSKVASSLSGQTPKGSATQSQHQNSSAALEKVEKFSADSSIRSSMNMPSFATNAEPKVTFYSVSDGSCKNGTLQNHSAHLPCVDKQETCSHSRISEMTDTGQRDSEISEKKLHSYEQSVSRTPTAITSTNIDEHSSQTTSQTRETSGCVAMPISNSTSRGSPPSSTNVVPSRPSANLNSAVPNNVEQKCEESMTTLPKESSEHKVKISPATVAESELGANQSDIHHQQQQQEWSLQQDAKAKDIFSTLNDMLLGSSPEYPRTAEIPVRQSSSRPLVDKQETFSRLKTSKKTETGTKEIDLAERRRNSFQQSFIRSPSISTSETAEEQCFRSTSETHEISKEETFGKNSKQSKLLPDHPKVSEHCIMPSSNIRAATKRISPAMQRAGSVDERGQRPREHVIPIGLPVEQASSTDFGAQHVQESWSQRQSTTARSREHIIPVRLSPFPERRAPLREVSEGGRYSVSAGWPRIDWSQPLLPAAWSHPTQPSWLSSDWAGTTSAAVWPEPDRKQPEFCCPVVEGLPAAALAPLYGAPPAGSPDRA